MAYPKANLDKILAAAEPMMTVRELIEATIADHARTNGCTFVDDAPRIAVERSGMSGLWSSSGLSEAKRVQISQIIEDLEIDCPSKTAKSQSTP